MADDGRKKGAPALPPWGRELVAGYESGAASQFILHGNVHDRLPVPAPGGRMAVGTLRDYLLRVLLEPFDVILAYDLGNGIRIEKGGEIFSQWPRIREAPELPRHPRGSIELMTHYLRYTANLCRLGQKAPQVACVVDAAELVVPRDAGDIDTGAVVLLLREWATDPLLTGNAVATFLVSENINDLHPLVAANLHTARIRIPLPDEATLAALFESSADKYEVVLADWRGRWEILGHQLAGATLTSIEQLLRTARHNKERLAPEMLVKLRRDLVERDAGGLISFIESPRTLDDVHSQETIKAWLRQDITLLRQNDLKALPMGYLLCGPVGTGKTFFVECLAGEAGVPVVRIKNFRDKWVGSTEGNLEKIFRLLHALGRCIVFVDEADQALGRRDASSGDSGVSGRVYGMIAEEMGNTRNRGKIIWILASSRPDLIEVDLKRPGRIDVKIPIFPTTAPEEGWRLIAALCARVGLSLPEGMFDRVKGMIPELLTPGAAEALAVKAYRLAKTGPTEAGVALETCLRGYQVPVPRDVLVRQMHLAAREATDLEFVPQAVRDLLAREPLP